MKDLIEIFKINAIGYGYCRNRDDQEDGRQIKTGVREGHYSSLINKYSDPINLNSYKFNRIGNYQYKCRKCGQVLDYNNRIIKLMKEEITDMMNNMIINHYEKCNRKNDVAKGKGKGK